MGCGCKNRNKVRYEVVLPDGKVAFTSPSKTAAEGVQRRYKGSTVRTAGGTTKPASQR